MPCACARIASWQLPFARPASKDLAQLAPDHAKHDAPGAIGPDGFLSLRCFTSAVRARAVVGVLRWVLLVALILSSNPLPAAAAPQPGVLQTIGDFLSLGANTAREIQNAIKLASGEAKQLLQDINNDLNDLLQRVSDTYQNNLNVTISSLDAATSKKLLELQGFFDQLNDTILQDIAVINATLLADLRQVSVEIRRDADFLKRSLEEVVVVGSESAVYVIDRAAQTALVIGSVVMLGIGLLLFVWLLVTRRLPTGPARMIAFALGVIFLVLFGSLTLWPAARAYAMTATGLGLRDRLESIVGQPRILDVFPELITVGKTKELEIWGSGLRPNGATPTVRIQSTVFPLNASSDDTLVVNVSGLTLADGAQDLVVLYDSKEAARAVVRVARQAPPPAPPDLTITAFTISPSSPVRTGNALATVTVRNQGAGPTTKAFAVTWQPYAAHPGLQTTLAGLNAGETKAVQFNYAYLSAGTFDSVATVDAFRSVVESNEGNNTTTRTVSVQNPAPRKARVTVTFTEITIHDDADPAGSGELWLNFNVGGQTGRWPNSGTKDVDSGGTYAVGTTFTFTLSESEHLTIFVKGTDEDSPGFPLFDDNDDMGTVPASGGSLEFTSANEWGRGSHDVKSSCPDGCYTIHFRTEVAWLP